MSLPSLLHQAVGASVRSTRVPVTALRPTAVVPGVSPRMIHSHATIRSEDFKDVTETATEEPAAAAPKAKKASKKAALDPELEQMINEEKNRLDSDEKEAVATKDAPAQVIIEDNEKTVGEAETSDFQAETKKILDIVARSLYSDKEIFLRELVSNASDAMEKVRHQMMSGKNVCDSDLDLKIQISVDDKKKILIIQDAGIGMTKEELTRNLGRIGFSGTGEFAKILEDKSKADNLIGQFGVGFYSAFMVSNKIKVYSKGASESGERGWVWESDGSGTFTISQAEPVQRGTKIVMYLRQDCEEFAVKQTVENIIKTHSNFVGFDISLNGNPVNTVKAIWTQKPNTVTPQMHKEFYQFISKAYDAPMFTLHFETDMPLSLRSIFYVPETHMEKYGMGRSESGVSLFSRKILIQAKCKGILPEWARFVKGVVDSEDVPLNLSREHLQDSALIKRLSGVLTRRLIKFFEKQAKDEPDKYAKFYTEFSPYLKEGVCTDYVNKEEISKLLRMESSHTPAGRLTSLVEYVNRMKEDQKEIYYLIVPSRDYAENSPYFESFKASDTEVLFFYDTRMDDFVMSNLADFKGKKLKTIEASSASQPTSKEYENSKKGDSMTPEEFKTFSMWMKDVLVDQVTTVTETDRLTTTPCIIVDHESASFRRMMKSVDPKNAPALPKQQVQLNAKHPIIKHINKLRLADSGDELAREAIVQVFDNALIQAGLLEDSRSMVPRINKMLEKILAQKSDTVADVKIAADAAEPVDPVERADPFKAPADEKPKEL
eukprot:TRINITY_DN12473_c0_g1_i1.p1 TRINITY_DN12473_c0_g1~~TRINITY_DN12473_c0_g1_i1.p1  ORF type:complete len:786 (+),score=275.51 TRINITY_DN12473_c0_g1_i1:34-2358(+)